MNIVEILQSQFPGKYVGCIVCSNFGKKQCLKNGVVCVNYDLIPKGAGCGELTRTNFKILDFIAQQAKLRRDNCLKESDGVTRKNFKISDFIDPQP